MCEEKRELKERLLSIMNYKKLRAWMIVLSLVMALLLAGCALALGTVNKDDEIQENEAAPSPTPTQTPASVSNIPQPEMSVSAEDFNKYAISGYTGEPYSLLKITLEDGRVLEKKYEGFWWSEVTVGDINNDGRKDIVLYLVLDADVSADVAGEAHVLYLADNELAEYPNSFIQNPAVAAECPESFAPTASGAFRILSGARIVNIDGRDLLRISHALRNPADSADGVIIDDIQYTDAFFNGEGWQIVDAGIIKRDLTMEKFVARYQSMPTEEQYSYQSLGLIYQDAYYAREGYADDPEEYLKNATAYIKAYMESNNIRLPEDFSISMLEDGGTRFFEQGSVTAKLFDTEFQDKNGLIAKLIELESDFMLGEWRPLTIVRIILEPEKPGKRIDINYAGGENGGLPQEIYARSYIPYVPLEESESVCYILKVEKGNFIKQAVSLEEWIRLSSASSEVR
jgi:hypothetical protein